MTYETILEGIKTLSLEERLALLESISRMLREELLVTLSSPVVSQTELTASAIRRLPLAERQRILAEAAEFAKADYQPGSALNEFTEALAGDEIHEYEEE
jgi:hypothetical protein